MGNLRLYSTLVLPIDPPIVTAFGTHVHCATAAEHTELRLAVCCSFEPYRTAVTLQPIYNFAPLTAAHVLDANKATLQHPHLSGGSVLQELPLSTFSS